MDILTPQIHSDFKRARSQASLNRVFGNLFGKPVKLMSFDEIKKKLPIGASASRGTKPVKLEQIVGSLNRHHDFDREFRPYASISPERWQNVDRAFYEGASLPAIIVYKVGNVYFVVDGHHRVSVARNQNQIFIDAEVLEFKANCSIASKSEDKDLQLVCAG
jgi:hypothetical protein